MKWFCAYRWHVGIRTRNYQSCGPSQSAGHFSLLTAPYGHFYGDPFIVEHERKTFLFLEDYRYLTRMARLICCELDENGKVIETRPILQPPYHVSYPQVLKIDGEHYMIPETGAAMRLELYRAVRFPWEWKLEKILMSGFAFQDPTHAVINGRHWIFSGGSSTGVRGQYDELHLFHAPTIHDRFRPHPGNPVKTDLSSARPAGRLLMDGESIIRPAQDCSRWYGCGIKFMRIDAIDEFRYSEQLVGEPPDAWLPDGYMGPHTYNESAHFEVIDICSYGLHGPAIAGRVRSLVRKIGGKSDGDPCPGVKVMCQGSGR